MKTKVIKVDSQNPSINLLKEAVQVLKKGGLVAFPTDTVYGLGANAYSERAIKRLFTVKRRSFSKPIIILLSHPDEIRPLVKKVSPLAQRLVRKFWPGPLSIVLDKSEQVSPSLTGGVSTIGLRCPDNEVALAFFRLANVPVATTSANISGRSSPTTTTQVLSDLEGEIDLVIDGGPTKVRTESTILDLTVFPPAILRPGAISSERLNQFLAEEGFEFRVEDSENVRKRKVT